MLLALCIVGDLPVEDEVSVVSKLLIVANLFTGFNFCVMFKFYRIARPLLSTMRHAGSCGVFCKVSVKLFVVFELVMVSVSLVPSKSHLIFGPPIGRRRRHGSFNECKEFLQPFFVSTKLLLHAEPTKKSPESEGI